MSAHGIRQYNAKKVVNRGGRDTPSHNAIEVLGANIGNSLNCEELFDTCAFEGNGVNHGSECLLDIRCATDGGAAYDLARCCGISMSNTFGVDGGFASRSINDCFRLLQGLSTYGQLGGVRGKCCKDISGQSAEDAIVCDAGDRDCWMRDERRINGTAKGGRIE